MVGRTFPFIGLPRDVIVLSVSIGPLLLSHTMACCCMIASDGEHYPHPSPLKTSRQDQHMRQRQRIDFIIPLEHQAHVRSRRGVHLMALAAATKDMQSPSLSGSYS